ncbi:MAG TPA: type II secretion system protein [Fibrobacteria bacterium]|nr:type II secretion system protein [Fibrobacteria bacterium]
MTGHESNRFSSFAHRALSARLAELRSRAQHRSAGFTMVELLVVIVIIGLLSGMAVPKFLRADAEAKLEGDAQKVLLNFRIAKQAASKTNLRHWVVIDPPRRISIWRALNDSILTFSPDTNKTVLILRDSLDHKSQFGVVAALKSAKKVPGFDAPTTAAAYHGLASSDSTWEDCKDGVVYSDTTKVQSYGWKGKMSAPWAITACGGSISDMTEGIAYLTSTGSDDKMYAIAYDRRSVQLRYFRYAKATDSWEAL